MSHTAIMLKGTQYIWTMGQTTSHIIAIYMPTTNFPTKLGIYVIYAKYLVGLLCKMYAYIGARYEFTATNHGIRSTGPIFYIHH